MAAVRSPAPFSNSLVVSSCSDLSCQLGLGDLTDDPTPGAELRLVPTPVPEKSER